MFRLAGRAFFALFCTLATVAYIWLRRTFLGTDQADALRIRQRWARVLLHGVGLRVTTTGTPPNEPCLVVSNHRTAIDPIVILRDVRGLPVSKAEVASWPVLGRGAQVAGGIVYLRRDSSKSRSEVLKVIADTILESGFPVLIFPEGTTSVQQGTLPFKPGTFRLAAQAGIAVAPVALVFENPADHWGDGEGFVAHIKRQFGHHRIRVRVSYGPLLRHTDGDELCRQAQAWVEKEMERLG